MAGAKGKTDPAGGEDQSMEEILQSIRKIIAEEGDEPAASETEDESADVETVLELTDAIQDDGSVVNVKEEGDILDEIDDAIEKGEPEEAEEDESEEEPEEESFAEIEEEEDLAPLPAAPPPQPRKKPAKPQADDGLVSAASIAASAEALKALRQQGDLGTLPFASGETVEGLVAQLLRPMLKDWLDANLPAIVQRVVQTEVKRIVSTFEQED